jgi:hypothetical protein
MEIDEPRYAMRAAGSGCVRPGWFWVGPQLPKLPRNKIIIADTPSGSTSSRVEEHFGLWIDEKAKTLALADGTPLAVRRFDEHWISAVRDDMFYEFDRQTGNLSYASSTTKNGAVTITIGSGRCANAAAPTG